MSRKKTKRDPKKAGDLRWESTTRTGLTLVCAMMFVLAGAVLSAPNTQFRRTSTGDLERVHGVGKVLAPAKVDAVVPTTEMPGQFGGPARQLPFGLVAPEKPGQYSRVVYNRVPKCGSSTMITLIKKLGERNNFTVVVDDHFKPSLEQLSTIVTELPARTFYINHCGFWPDAPPDVAWINMLRDPVSRTMSGYYYKVDPNSRGKTLASEALRQQKSDPKCGCFKREFDTCVRQRRRQGCPLEMSSAASYFCAPNEQGCDSDLAINRADERYTFVGLTEEYVRSVSALEALLPSWFNGASEMLEQIHDTRVTADRNDMTNTKLAGCVSNIAKRTLMEVDQNREEIEFYDEMKDLFWRRFASIQRDDTLPKIAKMKSYLFRPLAM